MNTVILSIGNIRLHKIKHVNFDKPFPYVPKWSNGFPKYRGFFTF